MMETNPQSREGRLAYLDLFRGVFALMMIQGHTFRALLDPSLKATVTYELQDLVHNLPGPAFLFASGAAFSIATLSRWEDYRRWTPRLRGRLLRLLALLAVGYMLHLTYFSLRRTLTVSTPEQIVNLLQMDILQCIGLSALLLQFLVLALPGPRWFLAATATLAVGIGLTTPLLWRFSQELPFWIGTNLSGHWASVFPLFPYAGFQMAGAAWGYLHMQARRNNGEQHFLRQTFRYSGFLLLGSVAVALLPLPEIFADFWTTGPPFFFLRVAVLTALVAGFRRAETALSWRSRTLALFGRESLLIYTIHLLLLHGSALNPDASLLKLLGPSRSLLETSLVLLLLAGAMALLAWAWTRWKQGAARRARGIRWSLAGILVFVFVVA